MRASRLSRMIRPRSIAVIGASARRHASANQAIGNLRRTRFDGEIHVVHAEADRVDGLPTLSSISELGPVDVALVSVPAAGVLDALEQLAAVGCASAIVPAVGLTSADEIALGAFVDRTGMAVCGPNTMGLLNFADNVPMLFWEGIFDETRVGTIGLVGQSGGACLTVTKSTELAGFSRVIAGGNEWGMTSSDYLAWLAEDSATTAVGMIIESIRDVPGFVDAVDRMRTAGKPLVVLQVGRTEAGGVATSAHTSALLGRPEIYAAFFRELDVPVTRDYDELAAVLDAYATTSLPRPRGRSIAVATVSGGVASLCADLASEMSLPLQTLSPATSAALEAALPGSHGLNPFDAGGGAMYTGEAFAQALVSLAQAPEVDSVLAILDGQATLSAGEVGYAEEDFVAVADAMAAVPDTPILTASTGSLSTHPHWRKILGPDVPVIRGIETGLTTLRALSMNSRPVPESKRPTGRAGVAPEVTDRDGIAALMRSYGLPLVESRVVSDVDEAIAASGAIGFPLVVKVVAADISHRSDVGGVALGVSNESDLIAAIDRIRASVVVHRPDASITGFELQRQIDSPLEAIVGFVTDPVFGPVISVGLGGVLVELTRDIAFARAPVTDEEAVALIETTHLGRLARGYRSLAASTDLRPLAAAVASVSRLAADHAEHYGSGDLNPVIITEKTGEIVIVDMLLTPVDTAPGGVDV